MGLMGKCPEWGHPQLRERKVESGKPVAVSYPTNVYVVHVVHNVHRRLPGTRNGAYGAYG